jgi:hypothetical protein
MCIGIPRFGRIIVGLTVLSLVAAATASGQGESTTEQTQQTEGLVKVPVELKPPAGDTRRTLDPWAPPDIDTLRLPAEEAANCPLSEVISKAGERVEEFVHNLDRFSATEIIHHQPVNRSGKLQVPEIQNFNYVFTMKQAPDGYMISEENRDMSNSPNGFPDQVATLGTPGLVLVFHPHYVGDFRMNCDGLGSWHGQPAWQIRFEELPDRPHRMSVLVIDRKSYDLRLRGIAWILADSYQVAHLEFDLAETIPKVRLRLDHQVIEYLPVSFPDSGTTIWLPSSAELYMDFRGHRFYRRHSYTNFKLFSVMVDEKFGTLRSHAEALPRYPNESVTKK